MVRTDSSRYGGDASVSPRSSPRIRASHHRDEEEDGGDQQSSHRPSPPLRLLDAHLRHHSHRQYPHEYHEGQEGQRQHYHLGAQQQQHQQHLTRSRSSPAIILDHLQNVHPGSSAANDAASLYWTHHGERNAARVPLASVHVQQQQHYQYEYDQEDARRRGAAHEGQHYLHRLDTYPYESQAPRPAQQLQYQQQGPSSQTSSYKMYEMDHQDAPRRSFTGKRKAGDEASDLTVASSYSHSHHDNVHLTNSELSAPPPATTLSPSSSDRAQQRRAAAEASAAIQTRRSFPPYPQSHAQQQFTLPHPQSHRRRHTGDYHALASSDDSVYQHHQRWLRRQEEETKQNHPYHQHLRQHARRGRSSETSLSPLTLHVAHQQQQQQHASSSPRMAHQQPAVARRVTVMTPAPEATLLPSQTRVITNASRNITFAMLQPHFERPLQEAALRFGVCTTLLKKICRKNGIKNWPFRRICGLHKSIASMEKQVHYFDGEQKRSYADQLYKLQLELAAYKRTGNALSDEFQAKIEAEGNVELMGLEGQQQQQGQGQHGDDDHAETKTEDVEIAFSYSYDGEGDEDENQNSAALSPPTLSAISTRVSVSSYRYAASPTNQHEENQEDHDQENEEQGDQLTQQSSSSTQQQYASVRHVMAATVDLGYDDHDERQQGQLRPHQHRHAQQQQQGHHHSHHHHVANPRDSRAAPTTSSNYPTRYLAPPQGPVLQRALPSLSFMLQRQSLSQQQEQRAESSSASPPASVPPANPRYYQPN